MPYPCVAHLDPLLFTVMYQMLNKLMCSYVYLKSQSLIFDSMGSMRGGLVKNNTAVKGGDGKGKHKKKQ
jgi:hypothetical protein